MWCSDEYEKRKTDPAYVGRKALDPTLLPKIVAKARTNGLTVSVHITNAADFRSAVAAGVNEIVHTPSIFLYKQIEERAFDPRFMRDTDLYVKLLSEARQSIKTGNMGKASYVPLAVEDVKLAAKRGIVTTAAMVMRSPEPLRAAVKPEQVANLKLLLENGVQLAIGSDNPPESSVIEADYLQKLGVFDNLTLLKMWTDTTARTIFPQRRIGTLNEGYEASFLALDGNPLEDWQNVRKIKLRFKQGILLEP